MKKTFLFLKICFSMVLFVVTLNSCHQEPDEENVLSIEERNDKTSFSTDGGVFCTAIDFEPWAKLISNLDLFYAKCWESTCGYQNAWCDQITIQAKLICDDPPFNFLSNSLPTSRVQEILNLAGNFISDNRPTTSHIVKDVQFYGCEPNTCCLFTPLGELPCVNSFNLGCSAPNTELGIRTVKIKVVYARCLGGCE